MPTPPRRTAILAALLVATVVPATSLGAEPITPAAPATPAATAPAKFEFEQFQLVLLLRPADRKELPEAEAEAIQKAHLAHLTKMGESGKMVVAGPFGDQRDASLRGACLYRVASAEEARALAEADPAVRAGRFRVEVVTWHVGKGYMTFPKAPAPAARP
jgi:uncharacterized protein YciI